MHIFFLLWTLCITVVAVAFVCLSFSKYTWDTQRPKMFVGDITNTIATSETVTLKLLEAATLLQLSFLVYGSHKDAPSVRSEFPLSSPLTLGLRPLMWNPIQNFTSTELWNLAQFKDLNFGSQILRPTTLATDFRQFLCYVTCLPLRIEKANCAVLGWKGLEIVWKSQLSVVWPTNISTCLCVRG